ncbi:MAG TPA: hypothetical protein ENK11_00850 [Phycisphaerales bacterium]|nr:hypothetical protein [Phycisphaerales bacterium]
MKQITMLCALFLLMLGGCASTPTQKAETPPPLDPRSVPVSSRGEEAAWADMVGAASDADVVVIGEMHGHPLGLSAAAALWEDILAVEGKSPALCLEFFDRSKQAMMDDYLTGVTDEAGFRKAAHLSENNYPPGHRAMVEAAKAAGAPVYASNAPRRYSTRAREEGLDALEGLRPSQRALYEKPDALPENAYRDRFFEQFRGMLASHGGEEMTDEEREKKIEGYFRAQSVWDATMAGTIARALRDGHRPVVQVVGQFHSDRRGGLIDQIWAHVPGVRIVTVSMVENPDDSDADRADFVVDVGGEDSGSSGGM